MALTATEQFHLELINRARLDPLAEAARYNLDLNAELAPGSITASAKQALAPNANLEQSAIGHSKWMLANDDFSHTGVNGSDPGERMTAAGYDFTGTWSWRENLAWTGTTGAINLEEAIVTHHEGLYRSEYHRENTFAENVREIGLAQEEGRFTQNGTTYNSSMLTQNYAQTGSDVFVTGVAYNDADADAFYSIGEGMGGFTFRSGNAMGQSIATGGYKVAVGFDDASRVSIVHGGKTMAVLDVDTSAGNAKVDIVTGVAGGTALNLSTSTDLISGMSHATLLGVGNLSLSGTASFDTLTGNRAGNVLNGEDGNDRIFGESGNDRINGQDGTDWLFGQAGNDTLNGDAGDDHLSGGTGNDALLGGDGADQLFGGLGNDVLTGGEGADVFVFSTGADRVTDFQDNVDTIWIDSDLVDSGRVADVLDMGEIVGGNAVFDFGDGDVLTLDGVTDMSVLSNDLAFI